MDAKEMEQKLLYVQMMMEDAEIQGKSVPWKDISVGISYINEVRQELKRRESRED